MSVVGENVKRFRIAAELSQTELSQMSRTTQPQISAVERGAISPTIATLERVAEALGVGLVDLVAEPAPKDRAPRSGRRSGARKPRTGGVTVRQLDPEELTLIEATEGVDEEQAAFYAKVRPIVDEAVRDALAERSRDLEHRQ